MANDHRLRSLAVALTVVIMAAGACGSDDRPDAAGRALGGPDPSRSVGSTPGDSDTSTSSTATTTTAATTTTTVATTTTTAPPGPVDRPPTLPSEPARIAAQLVAAELAVRNPATPEPELVEQAHIAQYAYRVLADHPEWDAQVKVAIPPELHVAFEANLAARRELRGMHTHLLETLPAWRIIEPAPYDELLAHYREGEATFGVPWEYLAAIHLVETGIGRVDGISTAGAQGPMQFMPGTWDAFGEGDVHNPRDAILAAARYLRHSGAPADMREAIFAYNRHYNYVRAIQHYASVIRDNPEAYRGYYHWQVYVLTAEGDVVMPLGYESPERVPVVDYLATLD